MPESAASGAPTRSGSPASGARIVVFGDVIDDVIVVPRGPIRTDTDTPSEITQRPGGSAANTAAWLGSLGASVDFVGMVGAADVERHTALLAATGVRPHLAGHPTLPTGTIVVLVDGESRSMLTERGANAVADPALVTDELLTGASVLLLTGHSIVGAADAAPFAALIARARALGVQVAVAPGSAGFLSTFGPARFLSVIDGTTILLPSLDEARLLTTLAEPDDVAAALAARFDLVVVTLGSRGAIVAEGAGMSASAGASTPTLTRVPAVPATAVDPTGAGDAFAAGFLAAWVTDRDAVASARAGVRVAARAVTTTGGRPA